MKGQCLPIFLVHYTVLYGALDADRTSNPVQEAQEAERIRTMCTIPTFRNYLVLNFRSLFQHKAEIRCNYIPKQLKMSNQTSLHQLRGRNLIDEVTGAHHFSCQLSSGVRFVSGSSFIICHYVMFRCAESTATGGRAVANDSRCQANDSGCQMTSIVVTARLLPSVIRQPLPSARRPFPLRRRRIGACSMMIGAYVFDDDDGGFGVPRLGRWEQR